ncbi:uncharacterized protein LOC126066247 [Elephas maximus indicus]|uniref:uncharacterized protein LOC126066247 n=1 Tax=Elephas maximus indicus TaxID=99487 RepID=UPI00211687BE|nr:uncharacterized protein LOC126066247 [Elephas maximus indicus]
MQTAAPTASCPTSHHPGFAPGAAAIQGKAPPPQRPRAAQHSASEELSKAGTRQGGGGSLRPENLGTAGYGRGWERSPESGSANRGAPPPPTPAGKKGKIPQRPPHGRSPGPPPPRATPASPSPPGLGLALAALRAARRGAGDMSGSRRSPRGPCAAAATVTAPLGINPGWVGGSGDCPHPSPPPQPPPPPPPPSEAALLPATPIISGPGLEDSGASLTRFWLRLRGANLPSPGPPPFDNKHNSARSSPGFSAGEEEEEEAVAALPSPWRPRLRTLIGWRCGLALGGTNGLPKPRTARETEAGAVLRRSGLGTQAAIAAQNDSARGETQPRCPERPTSPFLGAPAGEGHGGENLAPGRMRNTGRGRGGVLGTPRRVGTLPPSPRPVGQSPPLSSWLQQEETTSSILSGRCGNLGLVQRQAPWG